MELLLRVSWDKALQPIFGCPYWNNCGVSALKLGLKWLVVTIIVMASAYVWLITGNGYFEKIGSKQPHIIVVLKSIDPQIEFWKIVGDGIGVAAKEFDAWVEIKGPQNEFDVTGQIQILEDAILAKPDAIILAASDYQAMVPIAEKIRNQHIPLVIIDSGINSEVANSFIATDNIAAGHKMGELLSKLVEPSKRIAIVSHVQGSSTAIQREQGARSGLTANFSSRLEGSYFSNGSQDRAYEITKKLLSENSDIGGIAGLNEISTLGAAEAIKELGLEEQVKLVGFDSSEKEIKLIEEGVIQAVIIQKPFNMGYLGIKTAFQAIKGQKVDEKIDTGSQVINRDNMYTVENQKLLFPFVDQ
jgi:ribose transport system substrate-binding protein